MDVRRFLMGVQGSRVMGGGGKGYGRARQCPSEPPALSSRTGHEHVKFHYCTDLRELIDRHRGQDFSKDSISRADRHPGFRLILKGDKSCGVATEGC